MSIIYVDMDGVIVDFKIDKSFGILSIEEFDNHINQEGFFLGLSPLPGAVDSLRRLDKHFEVYLLSTAPWEAPQSWKEKRLWVEKHIPEFKKRLILSHHKNLLRGDYLIDDRTKNGAGSFNGNHILFASAIYPDWDSVLCYLSIVEGVSI